MKLHKDRIIQIVLGIAIIVLIGYGLSNNKNETDLTFELNPPEGEEVVDEEEASAPATATTTTTETASTAPAPTPPTSGGCYPSLSGRKDSKFNAIVLNWSICSNEDFQFYKLVKSSTNPYPAYPSDSVIASSANPGTSNHIKPINRLKN